MGSSKKGTTSGLHTPKLKIDDDVLPLGRLVCPPASCKGPKHIGSDLNTHDPAGVAMHAALALEYLSQQAGGGGFKSEL